MACGRVKWFNQSKGFGFLQQFDGQEVYFHYTSVESADLRAMGEGVDVTYDLLDTERGPEATNVQVLFSPPRY